MGRVVVVMACVEPDEDWFHGYAPSLPGLHIDAPTVDETWKLLEEGLKQYLEVLARKDVPFPENSREFWEVDTQESAPIEEVIPDMPRKRPLMVNV